MSESSTTARPRQVTMAGGLAIGGSIFLLLSVFETLGRLGSVELREGVAETVATGGLERMGIGVDQAIAAMRVGLSVAAVCAAVTLVAGGFVLIKHRGARIALTVAAVPIFVTSLFTGTLMSVLILAAAMLLWSGPARDWFAGRPVREVPTRKEREESRSGGGGRRSSGDRPDPFAQPTPAPREEQVPAVSASAPSASRPAPSQGYGEPSQGPGPGGAGSDAPTQQADPTAPGGPWSSTPAPEATGWGGYPERGHGEVSRPPVQVRLAVMLTWVGSGLLLVVGLPLFALAAYSQLDELGAEVTARMGESGGDVTRGMLQASIWILVGILAVWALAAVVLAWLTLRRRGWARVLLVISAAFTMLAGLLAFPYGLVLQLPAVVAFVLLLRPESGRWFAGRNQTPTTYQPPQQDRRRDPSGRPGPW